jgi:predicted DsbA family dithiol-disulfide isomerase
MIIMAKVTLDYFTDVLCIWAYVAQIRLDELHQQFDKDIQVNEHFITLFGNTQKRIGEGWKDKAGFEGFNQHVLKVAEQFPHLKINPNVWLTCRPTSSANSHLYLKAVQLLIEDNQVSDNDFQQLIWDIRSAFFRDAKDISDITILSELAQNLSLPINLIQQKIDSGLAIAALCADMEMREQHKLEGSPTYLLDKGRQKLYGNVGYRILEANVQELLEKPQGIASWC